MPSLVRGPVECWALRRLRVARADWRSSVEVAGVVVSVDSCGNAMLHMAAPLSV